MYRACKRVPDIEFEMVRVPQSKLKQWAYNDLFLMLLSKLEEEDMSLEDFIIKYTSRRDYGNTPLGPGWFTEYQVNAIPLSDAQAVIGRGY